MDTISGRRVAGFIALALAIIVGTVAIGWLLSGQPPAEDVAATPTPTLVAPSPASTPVSTLVDAPPSASLEPVLPSGSSSATPAASAPPPTFRVPVATPRPIEPGPTIQVPPPIR